MGLGTTGISINGIQIYNPYENPQKDNAYGRLFSSCCGHPQREGIYHYHKYPMCLKLMKGDIFQTEKEKCDELSAIIIEPIVQGAAGMVMHSDYFLKCDRFGLVLSFPGMI